MFQNLYNELSRLELKYHQLGKRIDEKIVLRATSLDPRGIDEVMMIKGMADRVNLYTNWDGQNVTIVKEPEPDPYHDEGY
ncbi:MAG: hypothetical protein R3302_03550 [Sulfurimonadaceae bacterium]|nr:hypothetical protein [Sulfurimonadaceae bacterium]